MAADRLPSAIRQSRFVDEPASSDGDVSRCRQTNMTVTILKKEGRNPR